ncbi:polysaccharide deacetylase family protein [Actinokineospora sp. UTMC 2448]|uniref:polysaccharide deacetylase family protein n=1 Tax=Actinokineospora sp. UTMC 2448 TaxID=2268449 RepID=UPI00220447E0|nr:Polysaccharide deacetylase [Actinokineospora sp. UTMC 2448]
MRVGALGALTVLLSACGGTAGPPPAAVQQAAPPAPPARTSAPPPDPAEHAANELGDVPVLMYHRITDKPTTVYDRTPADFRAELLRLAKEKYVPVTTAEYAAGDIDIPAGTHPVVLTFDDGHPSQFALTPQGEPVPGTAVAIMLEVAEQNPRFRPVASFYVNGDPFDDPGGKRTLKWLVDHDMEVGNHTLTHSNLGNASPEAAQRDIARGDAAIRAAGVRARTISLPFGIHPDRAELATKGSADGVAYDYIGALLVGANPAPSPYSADFDPLRIPRIRSQGPTGDEAAFGSSVWLDKLAAAPKSRYTSDGVPDRIAYPRDTDRTVAANHKGKAHSY